MNVVPAKKIVLHACPAHSRIYLFKALVGVGTKHKPLVRTKNSSLVNVLSEKLCIMFSFYWEVYVLINLVVNFQNEYCTSNEVFH